MFYENYLTSDFIQTLLFQACLPTRQNGVENRDKAYLNDWRQVVKLFATSPRLGIMVKQREQNRNRHFADF